MTFKELYTSNRVVGREKELADHVIDVIAGWGNPHAVQMIIDNMNWLHEAHGMPADLALVTAYSLCVIASSDEGTKCPPATTENQETEVAEKSTSVKPEKSSRVAHLVSSLGGYFELTIWRLVGLSASWSRRFAIWGSNGVLRKKRSGNWRTVSGRALIRRS